MKAQLLPRKHLPRHKNKALHHMSPRKRIVLASLVATASALSVVGVLGAFNVPTGFNIAAALIIVLAAAVETPLASMAVAKHK